jgi:hypothetical protein
VRLRQGHISAYVSTVVMVCSWHRGHSQTWDQVFGQDGHRQAMFRAGRIASVRHRPPLDQFVVQFPRPLTIVQFVFGAAACRRASDSVATVDLAWACAILKSSHACI